MRLKVKFKEKPLFAWSSIYGVKTTNGNYVFFRRATLSRNIFWYNKSKVRTHNGLYYVPPKFHRIMGWVYVTKQEKLIQLRKPVWGDAIPYRLRIRIINEDTIGMAIRQLKRIINEENTIKEKVKQAG